MRSQRLVIEKLRDEARDAIEARGPQGLVPGEAAVLHQLRDVERAQRRAAFAPFVLAPQPDGRWASGL